MLLALSATPSLAASAAPDTGSTAWILTSSALVLFMTLPGLALFYGGLVHARNVLSVLMQCFAICCIVSVLWAVCGYSLFFDGDGAWLGGLGKAFLAHLDPVRPATVLPETVFALYQMTFAVITPRSSSAPSPSGSPSPSSPCSRPCGCSSSTCRWRIGSGAAAGSPPWARWFAGGIVVHTTAGVSALLLALMVGRRRGFPSTLQPPHSPGMTMMGAGMLWVGWFGFNGGSALAADASAGNAILVTHLSASAGALAWTSAEWVKIRKPTSIGIVTGCVAGLATITPAAGYVSPAAALLIGLAGGLVCFFVTLFVKHRLVIDDSLDVFAVHGVGGILGSLLLAVFVPAGLGGVGLAEGRTVLDQLGVQVLAVVVVALWSGVATYGLGRVLGLVTPLRVDQEAEHDGLDLASHGERAYEFTA